MSPNTFATQSTSVYGYRTSRNYLSVSDVKYNRPLHRKTKSYIIYNMLLLLSKMYGLWLDHGYGLDKICSPKGRLILNFNDIFPQCHEYAHVSLYSPQN